MYLLILLPDYLYMIAAKIFTFHNVSINSINGLISSVTQNSFTFHNVSINSKRREDKLTWEEYLHSIMYLLILFCRNRRIPQRQFTFHNVSINSNCFIVIIHNRCDLHSIMYLLIRGENYILTSQDKIYIP